MRRPLLATSDSYVVPPDGVLVASLDVELPALLLGVELPELVLGV